MAETLLSFGVRKLWDLLARESDRFQGVEEQFNELRSDLNKLRCFLEDADAKKHTSSMVSNTVKEVKEIVYDTEDIIETFLRKEELGRTSGFKKHIKHLGCIIPGHRKIVLDMDVLSKRISKVICDMQSLGVQQGIVNDEHMKSLQEKQRQMRQTFSNNSESALVGLEENVKKLVGHLVEEDSSQVVSITGMGGIGKTTLARQVFNHETIKSRFAKLAWVCVSQQFTRKYVWQMILWKVGPEYLKPDITEDALQENLIHLLGTRKTLIVLDDLWREEDWDIIKPIFPLQKGWKVLLTSRNEGVALRADPNCFTFKPDYLTLEESWTLFRRTVFPGENTTEYKVDEEMEELGKEMIKHCGGLPLAIKVLGGLLAADNSLHEWNRIYVNIRSHIVGGTKFNDNNISSVYHILSLSFEEMPIYLKHCFLYLAQFPEDFAIKVGKLSDYLAAEGLTKQRYYDGATIPEVGCGYIENLVKRNMVISERDAKTSRFETCHLHDMMREVCLLKAEEENLIQIDHNTSSANSKSLYKARRIVIQRLDDIKHAGLEGNMKNSKIRSLIYIEQFGWKESKICFTRIQLMRVLDLSKVKFEGGKLPSSIGLLIHLRYLSLHRAEVSHLPSSMRNLKMLLYLNLCVHERSLTYIPNFLKELQKLEYLSFPLRIADKVNIDLGNLVNLETLENFSTEHGRVSDLKLMRRLRVLSIFIRGNFAIQDLSSSLSQLRHLESLNICYYSMYAQLRGGEGLVLDCAHLKQLNLRIYMPSLPAGQRFPSHLRNITLAECCLKEDPMPILEKLRHLNEVSLSHKSFLGKRMVCSSGGFRQLQKLDLCGLDEWEEWIVEEGSMPLLQKLTIRNCHKLKELPNGMKFIISLKELNIYTVHLEFKDKLSMGGADYYKVQHISRVQFV
ncbi:PREDICTED: probable disease resistance protein At1g59620 [Camelina sativa]|uniref:Probable disease resistance protein At1g59620 n=1 Tax=Camelina sativa TaxID=90675 RepID=A0ABM1QX15_CAMSA|nr:PREDICTED: probable disease resistance protein At1g59620 [Camelina sativa]XP_010461938.1 PREDICTED: probable disease resistance protein At1g59620 [Camelina sativa]XP_019091303.1 PREDICTED: probable disease resistance protein At1g59620 [Camelina sativa]